MPSSLQNIAFNGVYDLNYPKNISHQEIKNKADAVKQNLDKMCQGTVAYDVITLPDNQIRIVTGLDNPWAIVKLLLAIGGEDLAQQYINKTAVTLDVKV